MIEDQGGPAIDRGGASEPSQENRHRDQAGITDNAAVKGERSSPGDRDRHEPSSGEDCVAIDLDSARDRAS
jgi:hypothetical protein